MYSLAQLEARPSLTQETSSNGVSVQQQPLLMKVDQEEHQKTKQCQKQNNNKSNSKSVVVQQPKVQKPIKSVRIVEPPKAVVVVVANNQQQQRKFGAPSSAVPIPLNSFVASSASVNRPRSVTDALFAAAPEVVAQTGPPPPVVVAAAAAVSVAVATTTTDNGRKGGQPNLLLAAPEDMNKGFLQFADEVDPDLTSKYYLLSREQEFKTD